MSRSVAGGKQLRDTVDDVPANLLHPPGGLVFGSERGNCRGAEEAQEPGGQLIEQDPVGQTAAVALDEGAGVLEVRVPGGTDTEVLVFVLAVEERAAVEARIACVVPYPG